MVIEIKSMGASPWSIYACSSTSAPVWISRALHVGTKVPKSAPPIPKLSGLNSINSNLTHELLFGQFVRDRSSLLQSGSAGRVWTLRAGIMWRLTHSENIRMLPVGWDFAWIWGYVWNTYPWPVLVALWLLHSAVVLFQDQESQRRKLKLYFLLIFSHGSHRVSDLPELSLTKFKRENHKIHFSIVERSFKIDYIDVNIFRNYCHDSTSFVWGNKSIFD